MMQGGTPGGEATSDPGTEWDLRSLHKESGNYLVDQCFRLIKEKLVDAEWVTAAEVDGVTASVLEEDADSERSRWVRLSLYEIDGLSFDDKFWALLPEVAGTYDVWADTNVKLLHLFSPGDAIVRCGCQASGAHGDVVDNPLFQARVALRKDYPKPGMLAGVFARTNIGGPAPSLFGDRGAESHFVVHTPFQDGFCVDHYLKLPKSLLTDWVYSNMHNIVRMEKLRFGPGHGIYTELRQFYVVLSLRNGSCGPPLLPLRADDHFEGPSVKVGDYLWAPVFRKQEPFNFGTYLTKLLQVLGLNIPVWDSFAGRFLVPYQVVLTGSDWRRVSESFFALFGSQRTAYRRLFQDPSPPRVKESKEPRFIDSFTTELPDRNPSVVSDGTALLPSLMHQQCHVLGVTKYL